MIHRRIRGTFAPALPGLCLGLLATGCSSFSFEQFNPNRFYDARQFAHDERTVYQACRHALEAMNYTFQRGSTADGTLEMASRVLPGGGAQLPSQRRATLEIRADGNGGSYVRIGFAETSEERSASGTVTAGTRLVREPVLYEAFWERLDTALGSAPPPTGPTAPAAGASGSSGAAAPSGPGGP